MLTPLIIPGMDSGSVTRRNALRSFAPRSRAASFSDPSSLTIVL